MTMCSTDAPLLQSAIAEAQGMAVAQAPCDANTAAWEAAAAALGAVRKTAGDKYVLAAAATKAVVGGASGAEAAQMQDLARVYMLSLVLGSTMDIHSRAFAMSDSAWAQVCAAVAPVKLLDTFLTKLEAELVGLVGALGAADSEADVTPNACDVVDGRLMKVVVMHMLLRASSGVATPSDSDEATRCVQLLFGDAASAADVENALAPAEAAKAGIAAFAFVGTGSDLVPNASASFPASFGVSSGAQSALQGAYEECFAAAEAVRAHQNDEAHLTPVRSAFLRTVGDERVLRGMDMLADVGSKPRHPEDDELFAVDAMQKLSQYYTASLAVELETTRKLTPLTAAIAAVQADGEANSSDDDDDDDDDDDAPAAGGGGGPTPAAAGSLFSGLKTKKTESSAAEPEQRTNWIQEQGAANKRRHDNIMSAKREQRRKDKRHKATRDFIKSLTGGMEPQRVSSQQGTRKGATATKEKSKSGGKKKVPINMNDRIKKGNTRLEESRAQMERLRSQARVEAHHRDADSGLNLLRRFPIKDISQPVSELEYLAVADSDQQEGIIELEANRRQLFVDYYVAELRLRKDGWLSIAETAPEKFAAEQAAGGVPTVRSIMTKERQAAGSLYAYCDQFLKTLGGIDGICEFEEATALLLRTLQLLGFGSIASRLLARLPEDSEARESTQVESAMRQDAPTVSQHRESLARFQLLYAGPELPRPEGVNDELKRVPFKPDKWQHDLLNIVDDGCSALVVAPTSAGKTFISYYAMNKVLEANNDDLLLYVCPTPELATQTEAEVAARYVKDYQDEINMCGLYTRSIKRNANRCQILVTTADTADQLALTPFGQSIMTRVKWIILDEVHCILEDPTWERLLLYTTTPFLALSATVGNPDDFARWLSAVEQKRGRELYLVEHKERWNDLAPMVWNPQNNDTYDIHPVSSLYAQDIQRDGISDSVLLLPEQSVRLYDALYTIASNQVSDCSSEGQRGDLSAWLSRFESTLSPENRFGDKMNITLREAHVYGSKLVDELVVMSNIRLEVVEDVIRVLGEHVESAFNAVDQAFQLDPTATGMMEFLGTLGHTQQIDAKANARLLPYQRVLFTYHEYCALYNRLKEALKDETSAEAKELALDLESCDPINFRHSAEVRMCLRQSADATPLLMDMLVRAWAVIQDKMRTIFTEIDQTLGPCTHAVLRLTRRRVHGETQLGFLTNYVLKMLRGLDEERMLPALCFHLHKDGCEILLKDLLEQLEAEEDDYRQASGWYERVAAADEYEDKVIKELDKLKERMGKIRKFSPEWQDLFKKKEEMETWIESRPREGAVDSQYAFRDPEVDTLPTLEDLQTALNSSRLSEEDVRKSIRYRALQRGIALHHETASQQYCQAVEQLFRKKKLRVVFCTATLAYGINMPCRSVIMLGDSPELYSLTYQQMSGRAGRRGRDNRGNVIFCAIRKDKTLRLLSSGVPPLLGHNPNGPLSIFRLMTRFSTAQADLSAKRTKRKQKNTLTQQEVTTAQENLDAASVRITRHPMIASCIDPFRAMKKQDATEEETAEAALQRVTRVVAGPKLLETAPGPVWRADRELQFTVYTRFLVEYGIAEGILNADGTPSDLSFGLSHLFHTGTAGLVLLSLLRSQALERMVEAEEDDAKARKQLLLVFASLFSRIPLSYPQQLRAERDAGCMSSKVVFDPAVELSPIIQEALRENQQRGQSSFVKHFRLFAKQFGHEIDAGNSLTGLHFPARPQTSVVVPDGPSQVEEQAKKDAADKAVKEAKATAASAVAATRPAAAILQPAAMGNWDDSSDDEDATPVAVPVAQPVAAGNWDDSSDDEDATPAPAAAAAKPAAGGNWDDSSDDDEPAAAPAAAPAAKAASAPASAAPATSGASAVERAAPTAGACSFIESLSLPYLLRSPFVAMAGLHDEFANLEDLMATSRTGLVADGEFCPVWEPMASKLNRYLVDMFEHRDKRALQRENGLQDAYVYSRMNEFHLTMGVVAALLAGVARQATVKRKTVRQPFVRLTQLMCDLAAEYYDVFKRDFEQNADYIRKNPRSTRPGRG